jgi:penicillin-binding protein 1A
MLVQDAPIKFKGWSPKDFEHKYRGPVSLTEGLADSLNTVAVRLALAVGPKEVVKTAYRLGITSQISPDPSIALGTSEVSPIELAGAYVPFANGGFGVIPYVVSWVKEAGNGRLLYRHQGNGLGRVVSAEHVGMMNWMMSQTVEDGTAHRADAGGWPAAGKTGTSQDFRDAWFVGYTARLVTAVWVGNDDDSPTRRVTGGSIPVAIWSAYMGAADRGLPPRPLPGDWRPQVVAAAAPGAAGGPDYDQGSAEEMPEIIRRPLNFLQHLFGG